MEWIIENWYIVVALIAVATAVVYMAVTFLHMPTDKQLKALKEWLKYAVTIAERELGSGTGQLKLRKVYDMAISRFPWVAQIYDYEEFKKDVDDALIWLEKQLETNENIKTIVESKGE